MLCDENALMILPKLKDKFNLFIDELVTNIINYIKDIKNWCTNFTVENRSNSNMDLLQT